MARSPIAPPLSPQARLIAAWGVVAERVSAHKETREAVMLVLGYEQNRVSLDPIPGPADQAHADHCIRFGKREGFDRASLALLDPDYIAEQRELLQSEIEANQSKENES